MSLDPSDLQAWPFREAQQLRERLDAVEREREGASEKSKVIFETGFGPSGLPHIGTFGEVARTSWVRRAFEYLAGDRPTELIAFSDDMDGLRGIPDNVPEAGMLRENLGRPLCDVPDPFGESESFSGHMNDELIRFLDRFGFEYTFRSSKEQYRGGVFDDGLQRILDRYDAVRETVTRTLREHNRAAWSPFMPICEECGRISTTRVVDVDPGAGEVSYVCDRDFKARQGKQRIPVPGCGHEGAVTVFGGNVKVGWKVDWALRWYVFGVDYEMYGKDLIDSAEISSQIVETLGGTPPIGLVYEWFNDENGQAISKTKGNGLTIEEWLRYGPLESMNWYIYQNPSKAKKLYFGVIPRSVDSYLEDRSDFGEQDDEAERLDNPIWFVERRKIDEGASLDFTSDVSYTMLLNLVSVLNTADRDIVWEYLLRYDDSVEEDREFVDRMIDCAMRYYEDFVLPTKSYEVPPAEMMPAVDQFRQFLRDYEGDSAEELQTAAYTAGKDHDLSLGKWFRAMYRLLLGQDRGPRLGTFVHLYGVDETLALIDEKLAEG